MRTGPHPGLVGVSPGTSLLVSCVGVSLGKVGVLLAPRVLGGVSRTATMSRCTEARGQMLPAAGLFRCLRGTESKPGFTYSMEYYVAVKMNEPDMLV